MVDYATAETSASDGRSMELYEFSLLGNYWHFIDGNDFVTVGINTYEPMAISRSAIKTSGEIASAGITVTVPRTLGFLSLWNGGAPPDTVRLTIYGQHKNATGQVVIWNGRVLTPTFRDGLAELDCRPGLWSLRRQTARNMHSISCPAALYGEVCGVDKFAFQETGAADAVSGNTVTVNAITQPDGYFDGGFIEWPDADLSLTRRGSVMSQVGDVLTLLVPPTNLPVGAALNLYPGCDHTPGHCGPAKFNNEENYPGLPFMPGKNPFNGTMLF